MLSSKFKDFLAFLKSKKILIVTHDLVDIDSLGSCYALKFFLTQYFKNQEIIIYFSELTKSTKNFINNFKVKFPEFNFSYKKDITLSKFDVFLVVDTNNLNQIVFKDNLDISHTNIPYIFIDHHSARKYSNKSVLDLINENYSSTAEIILELCEHFNLKLTIPLKTLIVSAILTDSGFFRHGNNVTILNVSKLLSEDVNIQDILLLLQNDIDISAKIANIKGLQRVKLIRQGNYLIGITNVSSFGASVASMLIKMGFDIGIVISKEQNLNRFNTRAKKTVCIKTGLNLGKILEEISEKYKGSGGGHDGAASLTTSMEPERIALEIINRIKQFII